MYIWQPGAFRAGFPSRLNQVSTYTFDQSADALNACALNYPLCLHDAPNQLYSSSFIASDDFYYGLCQAGESGATQEQVNNGEVTYLGQCILAPEPVVESMYIYESADGPLLISLALGIYAVGYILGISANSIRRFFEAI